MLPRLAALLTALLLSCATTPSVSTGNGNLLSHEVVIDQRSGFLYTGNANMSGNFPTGGTTHLLLQVSSDREPAANPAANPAATRLLAAFPKELPHTATFLPDGESKGMIRAAGGRFEAFGKLNNERTEFTGTWFFDDLEGGNIHIATRGTIFP